MHDQAPWPAAVVFDLDGTLIDSTPDVAAAANAALAPVEIRAGHAEVRDWLGDGARALIEKALRDRGVVADSERVAALTEAFVAAYQARPVVDTTAFSGAVAAVAGLARRGVATAVCTNKPEAVARQVLAATGFASHVDMLAGGGTHPLKPDPAGLRACLDGLGISPEASVYVGDQSVDVTTARAAGVPVVLASFGYASRPVHELGADSLLDAWSDLDATLAALSPP